MKEIIHIYRNRDPYEYYTACNNGDERISWLGMINSSTQSVVPLTSANKCNCPECMKTDIYKQAIAHIMAQRLQK
jgi:hypothetical protein